LQSRHAWTFWRPEYSMEIKYVRSCYKKRDDRFVYIVMVRIHVYDLANVIINGINMWWKDTLRTSKTRGQQLPRVSVLPSWRTSCTRHDIFFLQNGKLLTKGRTPSKTYYFEVMNYTEKCKQYLQETIVKKNNYTQHIQLRLLFIFASDFMDMNHDF
jgi:hypothetical protein